MVERGFPLTRTMVKAFAWAISKRSGTDSRFNQEQGPSERWWQLFKNRHPNIHLRKSDSLERSHAEAFNPVVVWEYFDLGTICMLCDLNEPEGLSDPSAVQLAPCNFSS